MRNGIVAIKRVEVANAKRKGDCNEHMRMRLLEVAVIPALVRLLLTELGASPATGARIWWFYRSKPRDWPDGKEMETLRGSRCRSNCRRSVHRWRDRQRLPDVKEVE